MRWKWQMAEKAEPNSVTRDSLSRCSWKSRVTRRHGPGQPWLEFSPRWFGCFAWTWMQRLSWIEFLIIVRWSRPLILLFSLPLHPNLLFLAASSNAIESVYHFNVVWLPMESLSRWRPNCLEPWILLPRSRDWFPPPIALPMVLCVWPPMYLRGSSWSSQLGNLPSGRGPKVQQLDRQGIPCGSLIKEISFVGTHRMDDPTRSSMIPIYIGFTWTR